MGYGFDLEFEFKQIPIDFVADPAWLYTHNNGEPKLFLLIRKKAPPGLPARYRHGFPQPYHYHVFNPHIIMQTCKNEKHQRATDRPNKPHKNGKKTENNYHNITFLMIILTIHTQHKFKFSHDFVSVIGVPSNIGLTLKPRFSWKSRVSGKHEKNKCFKFMLVYFIKSLVRFESHTHENKNNLLISQKPLRSNIRLFWNCFESWNTNRESPFHKFSRIKHHSRNNLFFHAFHLTFYKNMTHKGLWLVLIILKFQSNIYFSWRNQRAKTIITSLIQTCSKA